MTKTKMVTCRILPTIYLVQKYVKHFIAGGYVEIHRETLHHKFVNMKVRNIMEPRSLPTVNTFRRKCTRLKVLTSIYPADSQTQGEIVRKREEFYNRHKYHDDEINLKTGNRVFEVSLVQQEDEKNSCLLEKKYYWLFAILGFSVIYRMIGYFSIGHMTYKIRKSIYDRECIEDEEDEMNVKLDCRST